MEGILDLLDGGRGLVPEQSVHAHDDARGAEPTLGAMAFGNSFLKRTGDTGIYVNRSFPAFPASLQDLSVATHIERQWETQ